MPSAAYNEKVATKYEALAASAAAAGNTTKASSYTAKADAARATPVSTPTATAATPSNQLSAGRTSALTANASSSIPQVKTAAQAALSGAPAGGLNAVADAGPATYTQIGKTNQYTDGSGVFTRAGNAKTGFNYKPVAGASYGVETEGSFKQGNKQYYVNYDGDGQPQVLTKDANGVFKPVANMAYDPYAGVTQGKKALNTQVTWNEGAMDKFSGYELSPAAQAFAKSMGYEEGTVPMQQFGGYGADPYATKKIGDQWAVDLGNGQFAMTGGNKVTDYADAGMATWNPTLNKGKGGFEIKQDENYLPDNWSVWEDPGENEVWSTNPLYQTSLTNLNASKDIVGTTLDAKNQTWYIARDGGMYSNSDLASGVQNAKFWMDPSSKKVYNAVNGVPKSLNAGMSLATKYQTDFMHDQDGVAGVDLDLEQQYLNDGIPEDAWIFDDNGNVIGYDESKIIDQETTIKDADSELPAWADTNGNGIADWLEQQDTVSGGAWSPGTTGATSYTQPTSPYTGGLTPWTTTTSSYQGGPSFGQAGSTPWTWGDQVTAGLNASDATIYDYLQNLIKSGGSMSQATALMGLDPGDISGITGRMNQYAMSNNKPLLDFGNVPSGTAGYYNYGLGGGQTQTQYTGPNDENWGVNPIDPMLDQIVAANKSAAPTVKAAIGGQIRNGGLRSIEQDPVIKRYIKGGRAGGQSDNIPAMLSEGEYVFDADAVSALGDGNSDAGARKLDQMRMNIRQHKRNAPVNKIPPKAKAPEQYLKGGK